AGPEGLVEVLPPGEPVREPLRHGYGPAARFAGQQVPHAAAAGRAEQTQLASARLLLTQETHHPERVRPLPPFSLGHHLRHTRLPVDRPTAKVSRTVLPVQKEVPQRRKCRGATTTGNRSEE